MTSSYRGYVKAPSSLNQLTKPDPGAKILKRNQEFLDDLREVRRFERNQEAAAYNNYMQTQQAVQTSYAQNFELQDTFARETLRQMEINKEKQIEAMKALGVQRQKDAGPSFGEITQAVSSFSQTAANSINAIKQINAQNAAGQAARDGLEIGQQSERANYDFTDLFSEMNFMRLANNVPFDVPENVDSILGYQAQFDSQEFFAETQASAGASFEVRNDVVSAINAYAAADQIRTPIVNQAQQILAIQRGASGLLATGNYNIQLQDGSIRNWQELSTIEKMSPYNYMQAYRQSMTDLGIDISTVNNNQLVGLVKEMDKASAPYFKNEIDNTVSAFKNNAVDSAWQVFKSSPTPMNATAAYMATFRQKGGDDKAARTEWLEQLRDLGYSDQDVEDAVNGKIPGRNTSWAEAYLGEVRDMLIDRSNRQIQIAEAADNERVIKDIERATAITEQGAENLIENNGVYTLATPEGLRQQIAQYTASGDTKTAAALEKFLPVTRESQSEDLATDEIDALLANGIEGDITKEMILAAPISDEKKAVYLNKLKEFDAVAPLERQAKEASTYISDSIKARARYGPASTTAKDPSINEAIKFAEQKYAQVYRNARLEGKSRTTAQTIATEDFQKDFGTDEKVGRYAVADFADGETFSGFKNFKTMRTTYDTIDGSFPMAEIDKQLSNDPNSIFTKQLIPKPFLEQVSLGTLRRDGMPAAVQHIAKRHNKAAFEILNAQLEVAGLNPIPSPQLKAASEAQGSIAPELQTLLNQYPSTVRTDQALIGSGQEPVYMQSSALGEEVKAIFGLRESPQAAYDAINRGRGGDTPGGATKRYGKPLTKMTLGQVKQLQATDIFAVGKYQFIPTTLAEAAVDAGVTDDMLFNEAVQDRIFFVHLDNNGYYQPWERWWIEQGGPGLALTATEKAKIEAFRKQYDPSNPWRQPRNMNPAVIDSIVNNSRVLNNE